LVLEMVPGITAISAPILPREESSVWSMRRGAVS
jgi:hypothetical protein